jgi:hypothetical protein
MSYFPYGQGSPVKAQEIVFISSDTITCLKQALKSFSIVEMGESILGILHWKELHLKNFIIMIKGFSFRNDIVPGYRSRGPGFDSRRYQIFWQVVGLEWGPIRLVRITYLLPE